MSDPDMLSGTPTDPSDNDKIDNEAIKTSEVGFTGSTTYLSSQLTLSARNTASTKSRKTRRRRPAADVVWPYARKHLPGVEPERCDVGRRLWYCKQCPRYSVSSTSGARAHMQSVYITEVAPEQTRALNKARQHDLAKLPSKAQLKAQQTSLNIEKRVLLNAAKSEVVKAALRRLIVRRNLPTGCVEWPELHSLVYSFNYMAGDIIPTSRSTINLAIASDFEAGQLNVRSQVKAALSLCHITTDTWHAPNDIEFQAINVHYVSAEGKLQKGLINLVELEHGHSGEEVSKHVLRTVDWYGIRDRLGFITGDNRGANDTLCRAIAEQLEGWNPVDNRLRSLGHIINLAVQAFLFAKDQEAVDEAERQSQRSRRDVDDEIAAASIKEDTGWLTILPLQKLYSFCVVLNRSDEPKGAFKKLTKGRTIHHPNATRWNSWWFTIDSAIPLDFEMHRFINDTPQLLDCELTQAEWRILADTLTFLQPF